MPERNIKLVIHYDGTNYHGWASQPETATVQGTIEEAIDCYTAAGAQFGFEGDEKGRLQPGMLADLVVLDEDPREDPDHVTERSIRMTWVAGDLVYSA